MTTVEKIKQGLQFSIRTLSTKRDNNSFLKRHKDSISLTCRFSGFDYSLTSTDTSIFYDIEFTLHNDYLKSFSSQKDIDIHLFPEYQQHDIYAQKIRSAKKNLEVASLATPLLASMIEEGFFNNKISRTIINSYLSRPKLRKIDALILACTHYPLIKPEIEEYYQKEIKIIDSAGVVAKYVSDALKKAKLLTNEKNPKHHFYVSDYTDSFEKSTKYFFKNKIHLEETDLWK